MNLDFIFIDTAMTRRYTSRSMTTSTSCDAALRPQLGPAGLALALVLVPNAALAHFPWVLAANGSARLILSETLQADPGVDQALVAPARLTFTGSAGGATELVVRRSDEGFTLALPGEGTVSGSLDLGLMRRGDSLHRLIYFPKAIVGNPFGPAARDTAAPVELRVAGRPGEARLMLLTEGRPIPDGEVMLVRPDGSQRTLKTDGHGLTPPILATGRHGAWARHWSDERGSLDGQTYTQVRRYATVVFDLPEVTLARHKPPTAVGARAQPSGRLPQPSSSLGAVVEGGWLYVYGGHVLPTHDYSSDAVSGAFHRMNLSTGTWEALPPGPPAQGMNLSAHKGFIYRVGGMQPRNAPGTPPDNWSLASAARFDPAKRVWEDLPSLSAPRSSHDLAFVGDLLIVVGGWRLQGATPPQWADTIEVLDLGVKPLRWRVLPQPFARRAFVLAVRKQRLFVLGGFDATDKTLDRVDIYDPVGNEWTRGPSLPPGPRNGFSPAAAVEGDALYASFADGGVFRMAPTGTTWDRVATSTPRLAHRMVVAPGRRLLLLGGAINGDNLDLIEEIPLR